ncbi:hypothetical protein ACNKHP_20855 [Shigella boydii]
MKNVRMWWLSLTSERYCHREAIRSGDDLLGAIISFRSKDEISTLNAQLTEQTIR